MEFLAVTALLCLCLSSGLATYGPEYKNNGPGRYGGGGGGGGGGKEEARIHLNSPKIILERPSINLHGGGSHQSPLYEDEPIVLENLHAAAPVHPPAYLDAGYSHGKVLDITAPIQVISHAPVVQERPILIRRPVIVSKGLTATQDHLEKQHYAHQYNQALQNGYASHGQYGYANQGQYGYALQNGYGNHGQYGYANQGHHGYAIPVSRALHEKTVVYSGLGPAHPHQAPAIYSAPLFLQHQQKAPLFDLGHHHGHGPVLQGGGSSHGGVSLKKY